MSPHDLAKDLHNIHTKADAYRLDLPQVIEGIGDAYITLDPENDTRYPSSNLNAVHFLGCTSSVTSEDVREAVALFEDTGCPRFYFWLSPSRQSEEIRGWLGDHGLAPFKGTEYPTLLRRTESMEQHETALDVRRLTASDAEERIDELGKVFDSPWPEYLVRTADEDGFDHFGVFARDRLVGSGGMYRVGDVGYLEWAGVKKSFRGRGGQSALIKARVQRAFETGCKWVCSETLYLLKPSLRKLQRNGFEIVYDKEVYEWKRP